MEYTSRIVSLSAIKFKSEKSDSSNFKSMQRRTEMDITKPRNSETKHRNTCFFFHIFFS